MTDESTAIGQIFSFSRNLVLAASAGTGKTHALVGVVVHLLLGATSSKTPVEPSRIVATTFSRKAAAEMRERLTTELEKLALGDSRAAYAESLLASLGVTPDALRTRARHALARAHEVTIGTLHAFATGILRDNALEVGIAPGFELLDETEARARTEASIFAVLAEAAETDADAVGDLVQVASGVREAAAQLARAVSRLDEDGRRASDLAIDETEAGAIEATFVELVSHARALAGDPRFSQASATIANAAKNKLDHATLATAVVAMCEEKRKAKNDSDAARAFFDFRDASIKSSSGSNREAAVRFMQTWAVRDRFAARSAAYRRLVVRADERARKDRLDAGVLAFADVLRMTRDVLLARPEVAARAGGHIEALLVDEFQDTSRVQRDIVALLWEKSPARRPPGQLPSLADARGHGLLVVGDRKQSIYGFRGASVAVFAESCVLLAGEKARAALGIDRSAVQVPAEPSADFVALRHNRRALPVLLDFANAFSAARLAGSGADLDEVRYVPETEDLLVPPEKIGQTAIAEPRIFWLRPPLERGTSSRLDEAFVVAARIAEILETGAPHVANDSAPSPRDIAVLSMTNEMLDAVAFALAARGIPYVVAGRGFFSAREVKDVIAFLRVLVGSTDTIALAEILRGPWCGISDASLLALADGPRGLDAVETIRARASDARVSETDRARIVFIADLVVRLREDVDRVPTADVLAQAIRAGGLEETLVQLPRGEQRVANVRKLVEMARAFDGSARHLAVRWADAVEQASSETEAATFSDEDDAVRLLTVHASKGLAFPIVMMPEVSRGGRRPDFPAVLVDVGAGRQPSAITVRIASDEGARLRAPSYARACERMKIRERAELHRLAYVGVTRAAYALYFVGHRSPPKGGSQENYDGCTVAVLDRIAQDERLSARVGFRVLDVDVVRTGERATSIDREAIDAPPPPVPSWSHAAFAVTALGDFRNCARRYELVHLLRLPERNLPAFVVASPEDDASNESGAPRIDARSEGSIAHRVLERVPLEAFGQGESSHVNDLLDREGLPVDHPARATILDKTSRFLRGAYAARIACERPTLERELPFVLGVTDDSGRRVSLGGAIDLLVRWPDGSVDVVDYKRARGPDPEAHAFQLDVYALAAREFAPQARSLRSGILFLGGDPSEPKWHSLGDPAELRARIAKLGNDVVLARWSGIHPRAPIATCRKIHCGYLGLCHPVGDEPSSAPPPTKRGSAQLSLF